MPGHELFDLSNRATPRDVEPSLLPFGRGHARQLARRRPMDGAVAKRLREYGQGLEHFSYTESFFRPARFVTKQALDVFGEATEPEMEMNTGSQSEEKR